MREWKPQVAQWYAQGIVVMREWKIQDARGMPQRIVVMRDWEDLGCAADQSHV